MNRLFNALAVIHGIAALLGVVWLSPARSAECVQFGEHFGAAGFVVTSSFEVVDVAVCGDFVYAACRNDGLVIADVSEPFSPGIVSTLQTSASGAWSVAGDGHFAYVSHEGGISIVDVSIPDRPSLIGALPTPGEAREVVLSGDKLWVADGDAGLTVIDVSDPHAASIIASLDLPEFTYSIALDGGLACLGGQRVFVVDVRDPTSPSLVSSVNLGQLVMSLALESGICCAGTYRLTVIDLSDAVTPHIRSTLSVDAELVTGIVLADERAFVNAGGIHGATLHEVDLSDPSAPALLATWSSGRTGGRIDRAGDLVAMTAGPTVPLIDVSAVSPVPLRSSSGAAAQFVSAAGSIARVAGHDSFAMVDAAAEPPAVIGSVALGGVGVVGFASSGPYAFVAPWGGTSGIRSIDCSDPQDLQVVQLPVRGEVLAAEGPTLYAWARDTLRVVDVSHLEAPVVRSAVPLRGCVDLEVDGTALFAACDTAGFTIVDVSDGAHPVTLGTIGFQWCTAADAEGERACALDAAGRVHVLDISDLAAPVIVGEVALGREFPWDIELRGRYAYVAAGFAGLLVVDVSQDPPRIVGGVDTPGEVRSLSIGCEGVYLADAFGYGSPLRVAPFQCSSWSGTPADAVVSDRGRAMGRGASPTGGELHVVGRNPFRDRTSLSWMVDRAHSARVAVYDVTGRLVQTLHDGPVETGSHRVEWDGRDREGRETAAGTYFVRTSCESGESVRVVRIR